MTDTGTTGGFSPEDARLLVEMVDRRIALALQNQAQGDNLDGTLRDQIMQEVYAALEIERQGFAGTLTQLGNNQVALNETLLTQAFPNQWGDMAQQAWGMMVEGLAYQLGYLLTPAPLDGVPHGGGFPGTDNPSVGTTEPQIDAQTTVSAPPSAPTLPPPPPGWEGMQDGAPPPPLPADPFAAAEADAAGATPHLTPKPQV